MLTVHHLGISQSDRVVWLCEELGIPYELKRYERDAVTRLAPAEYMALHPFGTAPVITDGDLTLGESGAILEYLAGKHGGRFTVGPDSPDFADYLFWLHFANASLMPSVMGDMIAASGGDPANPMCALLRARNDRAHAAIETRLGEAPYFAGAAFTLADIIMLFPLTTMRLFVPRDFTPFPNIRAYLKRIAARPAFITAMAKADPGLVLPLD